jgi:uncharacterized protein YkwD
MRLFIAALALALSTLAAHAATSAQVLRELNLARTAPQAYADILAARMGGTRNPSLARSVNEAVRFLRKARPLPPIALSGGMSLAAELHVAKQGSRGGRGHGNPWSRMGRYGQWLGTAGENIHYGSGDARRIVCALIVDHGVSGRGHRKNIFNPGFRVAGIAVGGHATYGSMCVMDFAGGFIERGGELADAR